MTKFVKTFAVCAVSACSLLGVSAAAQTAPATPAAPSYSPEQEQRFQTFQTNLQNKNLSQDYNAIVDCAGYLAYTFGIMRAANAPEQNLKNAKNVTDSFIMSSMLVGMVHDPQNAKPEAVQALVKSKAETYSAVYPGEAVFKDASSMAKFQTCTSYAKVNNAMMALAQQAMAQQQQQAPQ